MYTPVVTHKLNESIGEEHTVFMTYPNTDRLTGVIRPNFYNVRIALGGPVATQIARGLFTFMDGFNVAFLVVWMQNLGYINVLGAGIPGGTADAK